MSAQFMSHFVTRHFFHLFPFCHTPFVSLVPILSRPVFFQWFPFCHIPLVSIVPILSHPIRVISSNFATPDLLSFVPHFVTPHSCQSFPFVTPQLLCPTICCTRCVSVSFVPCIPILSHPICCVSHHLSHAMCVGFVVCVRVANTAD